ncbi:hypothetical protein F4804DRAFT_305748 [Jackrogersella minutella]|nr:hypothetical protein F4804DRAFT_305748 [Jackrogersella minutella]
MSLDQSRRSSGVDDVRRSAASRVASRESREQARRSIASYSTCEEDLPDVFTDMDEQCILEEATVMNAREVTIKTPVLPEKSTLRHSRFLDNLKRISIEPISDPHDVYLSSEEDASSSADDFSDYDSDSDSNESEKSPPRRRSHEESARAVSVIFIGRPCVVDLASGRRSVSPIRRPRSIPSSVRPDIFAGRPEHPPRKSSLTSTIDLAKENPSFLSHDPFATNNYRLESTSRVTTPVSPTPRVQKTSTTTFHRFQKSLSLVRKRSRPNLKDTASRDSFTWPSASASASTTDLLSLNSSRASVDELQQTRRPRVVSSATMPPQMSITSINTATSSRRDSMPRLLTKQPPPPPASPSPVPKRGLLSSLSMSRRRSLRIKI